MTCIEIESRPITKGKRDKGEPLSRRTGHPRACSSAVGSPFPEPATPKRLPEAEAGAQSDGPETRADFVRGASAARLADSWPRAGGSVQTSTFWARSDNAALFGCSVTQFVVCHELVDTKVLVVRKPGQKRLRKGEG